MTRRQTVLLFAGCVAILVTAAVVSHFADDPIRDLQNVGATEIPTDSAYVRWWHQSAKCEGLNPTYDRRLR